jgi:hypothetical protein
MKEAAYFVAGLILLVWLWESGYQPLAGFLVLALALYYGSTLLRR